MIIPRPLRFAYRRLTDQVNPMRFFLCLCLCMIGVAAPGIAHALTFKSTVYADGYSCPHDCDAHVVFNGEHNGTKYGFNPGSTRDKPKPCTMDKPCRICFDDSDGSCLTVMYRGAGPARRRFDFTPAFYDAYCNKSGLPVQVADQCRSFDAHRARLIAGKIYCVADAKNPVCRGVIARAESAKASDTPLWNECRALGEKAFNRKYARSPARQRNDECAYELHGTGGPNRLGERWARLLPAACQPGFYVGKDGTDCCDRTDAALGSLGKECTPFLIPK